MFGASMRVGAKFVGDPRRRPFASVSSTLVAALTVGMLVGASFAVRSLIETNASAPSLPTVGVETGEVGKSLKPLSPVSPRPTRMRLEGVIATGTGDRTGLAAIDVEDQGPKLIRVGEQLAANAILVDVGSFYVVIEENGNRRVLEIESAPARTSQYKTNVVAQGTDLRRRTSQVPQRRDGVVESPSAPIGSSAAGFFFLDVKKAMRARAVAAKPAEPPAPEPGVLVPPLQ